MCSLVVVCEHFWWQYLKTGTQSLTEYVQSYIKTHLYVAKCHQTLSINLVYLYLTCCRVSGYEDWIREVMAAWVQTENNVCYLISGLYLFDGILHVGLISSSICAPDWLLVCLLCTPIEALQLNCVTTVTIVTTVTTVTTLATSTSYYTINGWLIKLLQVLQF